MASTEQATLFPAKRLEAYCTEALTALGLPEKDAALCAVRIVAADLLGVDTHGIFRMNHYAQRIRLGGVNLTPQVRAVRENATTALVDGDNAMGHLVLNYATELAIEKARAVGMAWVGTFNGNHAGAGAVYSSLPLAHDMVAMYMTVANANHMAPWGGVELILGTNPISIAIPAGEEPPIVLDIATTMTSYGKVKLAAQKGESIPLGWMIDRQGKPLTDPRRSNEGFILPIGGYKGYGLNVAIGMLAGVLNGAAFGRNVIDFNKHPEAINNSGHMIMAMRVDNFQELKTFKAEMDRVIREIRESQRMDNVERIWLPGEMEHYRKQERLAKGIPLAPIVVSNLQKLAAELNMKERLA